MNIGIVGVGLMGHGIARNVMRRGGFALNYFDHPGNRPVDELVELGATAFDNLQQLATASDVVILCVTGTPQVEAILTGEEGVIAGLRKGSIVVDCSTALPASTLRMAEAVQAAGSDFIDAPMTRTAKFAHEGKLNLLLGGDAAAIDKLGPLLASFTESVKHVGAVSAGHRLKLLHNYVSVGFMSLLAEAAAQSADAGIDPQSFVDVLAEGGGGSVALDRLSPFILNGDSDSLPFTISNALKDFDYYRQMSTGAGAEHTIADGVHSALSQIVERGAEDAYLPELVRLMQKNPTNQ